MNVHEESNIKQQAFRNNGYFCTFYQWKRITSRSIYHKDFRWQNLLKNRLTLSKQTSFFISIFNYFLSHITQDKLIHVIFFNMLKYIFNMLYLLIKYPLFETSNVVIRIPFKAIYVCMIGCKIIFLIINRGVTQNPSFLQKCRLSLSVCS